MGMVFCRGCGKEIHETAPVCPHCGAPQKVEMANSKTAGKSDKNWQVTVLLCGLGTGIIGAHRFYVGKIGSGFAQMFTLGGFGIWSLIDFINILRQKFTDGDGNLITHK
jgi:TM2 domain-containing membrane protein YozV